MVNCPILNQHLKGHRVGSQLRRGESCVDNLIALPKKKWSSLFRWINLVDCSPCCLCPVPSRLHRAQQSSIFLLVQFSLSVMLH